MKRTFPLAATVAALLAAQPASAAANLIANGGFDIPGDVGEFVTLSAATAPADFGWSITGTVDVFNLDSRFGGEADPANGDPNALDLVGTGSVGGISQNFATVIGRTYRLTFDYANNPFLAFAAMDVGVRGDGGDVFKSSVSHSGGTLGSMNWLGYTVEFTATSASSTLFFTNTQPAGLNGGIYLDNVSVVDTGAAVPEPATWALMIGGFGLAGATLRRRRLAFAG